MAEQLPFDLAPDPVFSFHNFVEGKSNLIALKSLLSFPDWPAPIFILFGPEGCGKTHLGTAWLAKFEGVHFVDDCAALGDAMFTQINQALNGDIKGLLLADRAHPDQWLVDLPDLRSRLNYIPKLELLEPDEDILAPIIRKLFEDRGRAVKSDLVNFIISRFDRSVPAVARLVQELDLSARRDKRDLTQKYVASFLKRAGR